MMATDTCSNFQAHLFKKELCANCLKPQIQHETNGKPTNKVTGNGQGKSTEALQKNGGLIRSLPTVAPVASKTTTVRGSVFAGLIETSSESKNGSDAAHNEVSNGGISPPSIPPPKTARPVSQQIKRPKAPPPTAPDIVTSPTVAVTKSTSSESESHYYHKYGIGLKDKMPETMKVVSESDAGTETVLVALPYAAVDVTTTLPSYQMHIPPKLPATPSPMDKQRDGQLTLNRTKSEDAKLSPAINPPTPVIGPYEIVEVDSILLKAAADKDISKDLPAVSSNKSNDAKQVAASKDTSKSSDSKEPVVDGKNTMKKNKSFLKKLFRIKDKDDPSADEESTADTDTVQNSLQAEDNQETVLFTTVTDSKPSTSDNIVEAKSEISVAAPLASAEDDATVAKIQSATLSRRRAPPAHAPPPAPIYAKAPIISSASEKEFTKSVDDINLSTFSSAHANSDPNVKEYGRQTSSLERQLADKKDPKAKLPDKSRAMERSVSEATHVSPTSSPRLSAKNIELDLKDLGLSSVMEAIEDIFKKNASTSDISPSQGGSQQESKENSGDGGLTVNKPDVVLPSLDRQGSNLSDDSSTLGRMKDKPAAKAKPGRPMQAPPPPPPADLDRRRSSALELNTSSPPTSPLPESRPFEQLTRGSAIPTAFEVDIILPTKAEKSAFSRDSFAFGTLPRVGKRQSLTKVETKVTKTKKTKESVKKSRNKTLTEGIGVDIEVVTPQATDDLARQIQLVEDKRNKFMNRELPPLPQEAMQDSTGTDDDVNNLYEFVPIKSEESEEHQKASATEGNKAASNSDGKTDDKKKKKVTIFEALKGSKKSSTHSADYMLPTDDSSDDSLSGKKAPVRPKKPTSKLDAGRSNSPTTPNGSKSAQNSYVMIYANAVPPSEQFRCALTAEQALAKMSTVTLDTLQQIYDLKRKEVTTADLFSDFRDELRFVDITVADTKAELVQGPVAFYRAECLLLGMDAGLVMFTTKKPSRDMHDSAQLHFLYPRHTFQDFVPAALLPKEAKDAAPSLKASDGRYHAWTWVIEYEKIFTLDGFLAEMRQIIGRCTEQLERYISYCLAQLLDGTLGSHDSKHSVFSLKPADILAVTYGERPEKFLVINPACSNNNNGEVFKTLFHDLIRMVFYLLNIECPSVMETDVLLLKIPRRSRFSHALRLLVTFMLGGNTFQDLLYARNFLEFLLWGPSEDEITTMNLTKDPVGAFSIWLDMARHRTVARFAREHHAASVELTHMLRFLCTETGTSLRNIALMFLGGSSKDKSTSSVIIRK